MDKRDARIERTKPDFSGWFRQNSYQGENCSLGGRHSDRREESQHGNDKIPRFGKLRAYAALRNDSHPTIVKTAGLILT